MKKEWRIMGLNIHDWPKYGSDKKVFHIHKILDKLKLDVCFILESALIRKDKTLSVHDDYEVVLHNDY